MVAFTSSFPSPKWVVYRIHGHASHPRPTAKPPTPTSLPVRDVLMLKVADLPEGGFAVLMHQPHFSRRELHGCVYAFSRHQLRGGPGTPDNLSPFAYLQLYVVDNRPNRNTAQRQTITGPNICRFSRHDSLPNSQTDRGQDVTLLAIPIMEAGNMCRAIGIIFYGRNRRPNPVLVAAEVYQTITPFMSATPVQDSESPSIIPPTMLMEGCQQGPFRPLFCLRHITEAGDALEASPSRRRFVLSDSHELRPFKKVDTVAIT